MSSSLVQLGNSPLFEVRPPLLVVPAVIILGLVLVYGPGKYFKRGIVGPDKALKLSIPAVVAEVGNVVLTAWIYLKHDPTPLAVGSPASIVYSESGRTARIVEFSVMFAAFTTSASQIQIATAYARVSRGGWSKYMLLAMLGFVLTIGALALSDVYREEKSFTLEAMNWAVAGCACALYFDGALTVELYKLRDTISKDDKWLHSRLLHISRATFCVASIAALLMPLCVLLGLLPEGWLSFNLEFAGFLTSSHVHALSSLLMWQAIREDDEPGVATAVGYQLRTDIQSRPGNVLSDV